MLKFSGLRAGQIAQARSGYPTSPRDHKYFEARSPVGVPSSPLPELIIGSLLRLLSVIELDSGKERVRHGRRAGLCDLRNVLPNNRASGFGHAQPREIQHALP